MNIQNEGTDEMDADTFGKAVSMCLNEGVGDLPQEVTERLEAARTQAIAIRRAATSDANATASEASRDRDKLPTKVSVAAESLKASNFRPQPMLTKP